MFFSFDSSSGLFEIELGCSATAYCKLDISVFVLLLLTGVIGGENLWPSDDR